METYRVLEQHVLLCREQSLPLGDCTDGSWRWGSAQGTLNVGQSRGFWRFTEPSRRLTSGKNFSENREVKCVGAGDKVVIVWVGARALTVWTEACMSQRFHNALV